MNERILSKMTSIRALSVLMLVGTLCISILSLVFYIVFSVTALEPTAKEFCTGLLSVFCTLLGQTVSGYFNKDRKEEV